jgi:hypothetical protein
MRVVPNKQLNTMHEIITINVALPHTVFLIQVRSMFVVVLIQVYLTYKEAESLRERPKGEIVVARKR